MKKNKLILIVFISLFTLLSCSENLKQKRNKTITTLLKSIGNDNYTEFRKLILIKSATMNENHDFPLLQRLHNKSLYSKNFENFSYEIIDSLNIMEQFVVKLPYYRGYDSLTAITSVDLILYFGPDRLFPLNKFSGFETEFDWDHEKRRKLLGLPPLSKKADSLRKATGKSIIEKPDGFD